MSEKVHERLDSWKAIAEYLDRDPTTVMRWAKERGLPVYTVPGDGQRRRAVYAYKREIDAWLKKSVTAGSRVNERTDQSGIPRSARNDSQPLGELADGGSAARKMTSTIGWSAPRRLMLKGRPKGLRLKVVGCRRSLLMRRLPRRHQPPAPAEAAGFQIPHSRFRDLGIVTPRRRPRPTGGLFGRRYPSRSRGGRLAEAAKIGAKGLGG
jgi:hypothetical protein